MHELPFLHQKQLTCSVVWQCFSTQLNKLLCNITPIFCTVEEVTVHCLVANCDPRDFVYYFFGPISYISVLSELNRRKLLVMQSYTFLTHSVSLDNLEVSSGLVEIYS